MESNCIEPTSIFRKVPVSETERLPEFDKFVPTVDALGQIIIYRRIKESAFKDGWCWSLREPTRDGINNNQPVTHWLEEVEINDETMLDMFKKAIEIGTSGLDIKDIRRLRSGFELAFQSLTGELQELDTDSLTL